MNNNKLIIFDFADTIAKLSPTKEDLVKKYIHEKSGLDIPLLRLEETYHYLNNIYFYSSVNIHSTDDKTEFYTKYNRLLFELLGVSHLVSHEGLYKYFKNSKQHWKLKPDALILLKSLKTEGYLLSLLSNFDRRLITILKDMNIYELFDSVYISQEHNLEKPNLSFFELPINKHKIDRVNTYFLGDNYHLDFLPSIALGLHPILLDEHSYYPQIDSKNRATSLLECQDIIKKTK